MMTAIQSLIIFDEHNSLVFNHVYTGQPPPPASLLQLYLQEPSPRPSVLYLPSFKPPCVLISAIHDGLLFFSPLSREVEPLLVLEFMHRVADAFEEFLGSPLLASKITGNYDIVAQIVAEMADAGTVCQGEANALRDVVETGPGVLKNLLGGVGLPSSSPGLSPTASNALQFSGPPTAHSSQGSAIPWRRSNVRHTSNELYVDIVESLIVTLAPSGRPISAFANGSIAFTSKVSGVPDLLLNLSLGGKGSGMGTRGDQLRTVMERTLFHPCVRLNRWKTEGVLSFVPPDGKFILCGYEADLLGADTNLSTTASFSNLNLPASIEVTTGLGASGMEFEVRAFQPSSSSSSFNNSSSAATASLQSHLGSSTRPNPFRAASSAASGDSKNPALEEISVHIPLPTRVRNISDLRPSRGDAVWIPADHCVEWKIPAKHFTPGSTGAVLRCTVQGPLTEDLADTASAPANGLPATTTTYDYDDVAPAESAAHAHASSSSSPPPPAVAASAASAQSLMPTSATLSFAVRGWLASGLKVESLQVDMRKSRGVGPDVKPYKGVKYLTVSRKGIEVRC